MEQAPHPDGTGSAQVGFGVVDEHGSAGRHTEPRERQLVDPCLWLAKPHLSRDDDRVEQGVEPWTWIGVAPAVGQQPHLEADIAEIGQFIPLSEELYGETQSTLEGIAG